MEVLLRCFQSVLVPPPPRDRFGLRGLINLQYPRYNGVMKRWLFIAICTPLVLIAGIFVWNSSRKYIEVDAPTLNQNVATQFIFSGRISSLLLKDSSFDIDLTDNSGNLILGQLVEVSVPWWAQFISVPIYFNQQIDTSGITAETPTCFGRATLVVSSFFDEKSSVSVPINCTSK